jgi:hypothetical protein
LIWTDQVSAASAEHLPESRFIRMEEEPNGIIFST